MANEPDRLGWLTRASLETLMDLTADWVSLAWIASDMRETPTESEQQERTKWGLILELVIHLDALGLARPGTLEQYGKEGWQPLPGSFRERSDYVIERFSQVNSDWESNLGYLFWLCATPKGEALGLELLENREELLRE